MSAYHGAQGREGIVLIKTATGQKAGEIKVSGGSVAVGSSKLWIADVAGRAANHRLTGRLEFAVENARPAAPLEQKANTDEPMPLLLANAADGGCWFIERKPRRLGRWDAAGQPAGTSPLPESLGEIVGVKQTTAGLLLIGTRGVTTH